MRSPVDPTQCLERSIEAAQAPPAGNPLVFGAPEPKRRGRPARGNNSSDITLEKVWGIPTNPPRKRWCEMAPTSQRWKMVAAIGYGVLFSAAFTGAVRIACFMLGKTLPDNVVAIWSLSAGLLTGAVTASLYGLFLKMAKQWPPRNSAANTGKNPDGRARCSPSPSLHILTCD